MSDSGVNFASLAYRVANGGTEPTAPVKKDAPVPGTTTVDILRMVSGKFKTKILPLLSRLGVKARASGGPDSNEVIVMRLSDGSLESFSANESKKVLRDHVTNGDRLVVFLPTNTTPSHALSSGWQKTVAFSPAVLAEVLGIATPSDGIVLHEFTAHRKNVRLYLPGDDINAPTLASKLLPVKSGSFALPPKVGRKRLAVRVPSLHAVVILEMHTPSGLREYINSNLERLSVARNRIPLANNGDDDGYVSDERDALRRERVRDSDMEVDDDFPLVYVEEEDDFEYYEAELDDDLDLDDEEYYDWYQETNGDETISWLDKAHPDMPVNARDTFDNEPEKLGRTGAQRNHDEDDNDDVSPMGDVSYVMHYNKDLDKIEYRMSTDASIFKSRDVVPLRAIRNTREARTANVPAIGMAMAANLVDPDYDLNRDDDVYRMARHSERKTVTVNVSKITSSGFFSFVSKVVPSRVGRSKVARLAFAAAGSGPATGEALIYRFSELQNLSATKMKFIQVVPDKSREVVEDEEAPTRLVPRIVEFEHRNPITQKVESFFFRLDIDLYARDPSGLNATVWGHGSDDLKHKPSIVIRFAPNADKRLARLREVYFIYDRKYIAHKTTKKEQKAIEKNFAAISLSQPPKANEKLESEMAALISSSTASKDSASLFNVYRYVASPIDSQLDMRDHGHRLAQVTAGIASRLGYAGVAPKNGIMPHGSVLHSNKTLTSANRLLSTFCRYLVNASVPQLQDIEKRVFRHIIDACGTDTARQERTAMVCANITRVATEIYLDSNNRRATDYNPVSKCAHRLCIANRDMDAKRRHESILATLSSHIG